MDIFLAYQMSIGILSFGILVASLEELASWSVFTSKGILSWDVSKLGVRWLVKSSFAKPLNFLLNDKVFKALVYARTFSSFLSLIGLIFHYISPTLLFSMFLLNAIPAIRSGYGLNGAYQMRLILLFTLSIGCFYGMGSPISVLCLWFIVAQLLLAYFISGFTKLNSPVWRNSLALKGIFSTRCFGHSSLHYLFSRSDSLTTTISWLIFSFEILFFIVLFLPPYYALPIILAGVLFHVFNALFMGLNDFMFAFPAAYPALIYCITSFH